MRITAAIHRPLPDEHVLGVDPPLAAQASAWRRRLHAFTGRALGDRALTAEQDARAGVQRLRGQGVSAGIVGGLDVLPEPDALGAAPAAARLQVLPGSGLTLSGEDVIVSAPRSVAIADLPVRARADLLDAIAAGAPPPPAAVPGEGGETPVAGGAYAGLWPLLPRRLAKAPLGALLEAPASAALPRVAVLVAQPVTTTLLAGPRDACTPDPRDDPYDDLQRIDGVRLLLDFWPAELRARAGGPDYSLPADGPARRNALAWRVFAIEHLQRAGERHPWEQVGVPLALVGFNPDWTLAFVDRASVARLGGRPRPRAALVPQGGTPQLWQARITQFAEQLASLGELSPATLFETFRQLPPAGFLPIDVLDLEQRQQRFFPAGFRLSLAPLPLEQVDLAIGESAALAPLNLDALDEVELLVPVPERLYEPGLLETAQVDPAFARAITRAGARRSQWLLRRESVRRFQDVLADAASGRRPAWPTADTTPRELLPDAARAPLSCTRVRELVAGTEERSFGFSAAGSSLQFAAGDTVYVWMRILDPKGLSRIVLGFGAGTRSGSGDFSTRVFWANSERVARSSTQVAQQRVGPLPAAGAWQRLEIPVDRVWTASGGSLAGVRADAFTITQHGGTVQWGPLGRVDPRGFETVWVGDSAPAGAQLFDSATPDRAGWPQVATGSAPEPAEAELGTIDLGGVRSAAAVQAFRERWPQEFLQADLAELDEVGAGGLVESLDARLKATNDAIDLGFVRARADIYRLRQYMLGADAAARLVTSPALSDIATREQGARASSLEIASFLKTAYQTDFRRDPEQPLATSPWQPTTDAAGGTTATRSTEASRTTDARTDSSPRMESQPTYMTRTTTTSDAYASQPRSSESYSLSGTRAAQFEGYRTAEVGDVQAQQPMPGAIERTASVAERLRSPPAVDAHHYALDGKLGLLTTIAGLIGLGEQRAARPTGIALGDLPAPGFRLADSREGPRPTVRDVILDLRRPAGERRFEDVDELRDSGAGAARHEADYFGGAARALDNSIALMRLVEGRCTLYARLLAEARSLRQQLATQIAEGDARLRTIGIELEEARHDVAVASALRTEEEERVAALNARRRAILEQHADIVLFRRPRRAPVTRALASAPASAALTVAPIVACRREHPAVPEEIQAYVQLLREAPVAWFPQVHPELVRIDRLEAVRGALADVRLRASVPLAAVRAPAIAEGARVLMAAAQLTTAQRAVFEERRVQALQLDAGSAALGTLAAARQALLQGAALADLIGGRHNRPTLTRAAAAEIEEIGHAAACLHAAFGDTPALARLRWAELLSQHDGRASLRELSGLAGWSELPLELRRTQQGLVDWLFGRVAPGIAAAVTAINELVRICLLLSAHAPVDRLIPARLAAPAPPQVGGRLGLQVDVRVARIGMTALVRDADARVLAQAVIEDLGEGVAQARIVRSYTSATIAAGTRVELSELRSLA